jgi:hypothetical protein
MIIRRRHTKQFVTLENQLVRDRRLSLDEHGMLHYLLSLPDDWEVSRANCAKFWDIGRDKAARIFRSLRKFGWAQVERVHGEDGTFLGVRWIITDEPGAEISDAELDREPPEPDAELAEAAAPNHDTENPCDGSPGVRVTRDADMAYHGYNIESKKTDSEENRLPQTGVRARSDDPTLEPSFAQLVQAWPPDHVLSRVASEQAWQRLPKPKRVKADRAVKGYLSDCARHSRKVCDLATYLREERFEKFAAGGVPYGVKFTAKPYSAQWHRWREYKLAKRESIGLMESQASKGVGWTTDREWPPGLSSGERANIPTGPPAQAAASEDDLADFR